MKEPLMVRLSGLPLSCDECDILRFFEPIKIKNGPGGIHLPEASNSLPDDVALVELETEEDLKEAELKHNKNIGESCIQVHSAKKEDLCLLFGDNIGVVGTQPQDPTIDDGCWIKIACLPKKCSNEDLVWFFDGLEIAPNGIVRPPETTSKQGKPARDAFVQFVSEGTAHKAYNRNKRKIGDSRTLIFKTSWKEVCMVMERRGGIMGAGPTGGFGGASCGLLGGGPSSSGGNNDRGGLIGGCKNRSALYDIRPRTRNRIQDPLISTKRLYVGGMKHGFTKEELVRAFSKYGNVLDVIIPLDDETKRRKGYAFVNFDDPDSVDKAFLHADVTLNNRKVMVDKAKSPKDPRSLRGPNNCGSNWGNGNNGPTGGTNTNKWDRSAPTKTLYVGGMSNGFTKQDLIEAFSKYGNVVDVMIPTTAGRKNEFAFLEFDDTDSVDKAFLQADVWVNNKKVTVDKAAPGPDALKTQQTKPGLQSYGGSCNLANNRNNGPNNCGPNWGNAQNNCGPNWGNGPNNCGPNWGNGPNNCSPNWGNGPNNCGPNWGNGPNNYGPNWSSGPNYCGPTSGSGPNNCGPNWGNNGGPNPSNRGNGGNGIYGGTVKPILSKKCRQRRRQHRRMLMKNETTAATVPKPDEFMETTDGIGATIE